MHLVAKLLAVYLLQFANLCSGLANSIVTITIPWLILEQTDSPAFAGLVVAISALPALLVSPIGGWMVDRWGRRAVSVGSDLLSALSVMAFPVAAAFSGMSNTTILILALIGAMFDPAGYTARKTLLADVSRTSRVHLDQLNGIHEGILGISWILGPAIGAWLIATIGSINSFWVAAALFMCAALTITLLQSQKVQTVETQSSQVAETRVDSSIWAGFRVLWKDRLLRTLLMAVLVIAAVYLPTESVLLPTYFEQKDQPSSLGLVISAMAAGSTIGAFGYGWISARLSRRSMVRTTLIGISASIVPMALLPPLALMASAGFILGLCWGPFNPLLSSLIQQRVPPEQHGRVFGAQISVFYAAPPLGMVAAGWSVEQFGVGQTYLILAGLLCLIVAISLSSRALRSPF